MGGFTLVVAVAATVTVLVVVARELAAALIAVVLLPGMPLLTYLSCNRRGYALQRTGHSVAQRCIFWQRQVIQPFVRIQHIELARGPLEKRLELAGLRIFSAGTGAETMTIPGLNLATAQRIRSHLLDAQNT